MPEIRYETVKHIECKETGFKEGDIVVGVSYWYRTTTTWYRILKVTNKEVTLEELPTSYPTKYMSNTPGSECVPVLKYGEEYYVNPNFPFWLGPTKTGIVKARPYKIREYEIWYNEDGSKKIIHPKEKKWEYHLKLSNDRYKPSLSLWDGKPGWVNCD